MPPKPKRSPAVEAPWAPIPSQVLDQFVHQGLRTPQELDAVLRRFKKAVIDRALSAELAHHLKPPADMSPPGETVCDPESTSRAIAPTRDDTLADKHDRPFTGLDDKIVALYARGLTVRGIQAFLGEMYAVEVSPDLIGAVTESVVTHVASWQARPLEPMYPVVFFDALRVKIHDTTVVGSRAVYVAVGVLPDGTRDILGLWIEPDETAELWLKVFADLKARGCHDILIAVADGNNGLAEALGPVFPETTLQISIARLIRHSLEFARWKERRALAAALRPIHTAPDANAALMALDAFERGAGGARFPTVVVAWRRAWTSVIPFFAFPPAVRRVISTTSALESVRARLRAIIKAHAYFRSDDAAATAIWLALRHITASRAPAYWKTAMNQFAMLFEDRFTRADI